jgi:hypothetical protein
MKKPTVKIRLAIYLSVIWFVIFFFFVLMSRWWVHMLGEGGSFLFIILTISLGNFWVRQGFKKYKGS